MAAKKIKNLVAKTEKKPIPAKIVLTNTEK